MFSPLYARGNLRVLLAQGPILPTLVLAAATAGAGILTVGSGLPIAGKLMAAFGGGLAGDATLWTYIGVVGGVSSGLLGSFALRRIIADDSVAKVRVAAG